MLTRRTFLGAVSAGSALATGLAHAHKVSSVDDPLGVRADFPAVKDTIFLDSAYTSISPRQAIKAAQDFIAKKAHSPFNVPEMLGESITVRERFARLIGASKEEIGLVYATSDGENIVTEALNFSRGDNVVIDDLHYRTTYVLYQNLQEKLGIEVRLVRSVNGAALPKQFAEQIDERTRLVSVSWVSHANGYCHDLKTLAALAHKQGAYLYVDAIQGIGMLDLNVKDADVDFLASGSYKWLLAGYGVAPFYVRKELMDLITPDRYGGFQAAEPLGDHRFRMYTDGRKFQYATMSFDSVYYLNASLDYILRIGVPNIEKHTVGLAHTLHRGLSQQGYDVWTPAGNRSSIVTFKHGRDAKFVRHSLESAGIKVTISDGDPNLRIGIALFNTETEINRLLELTASWA